MKKQIAGIIQSVNLLREGETNGRKWQMFEVMINDQKFITFDWGYKNKLNQSGTFTYEETAREKDGKTYVSKTLENLPRPKPITIEQFSALEERVKRLENQINFPQGEEAGGHIEEVGGFSPENEEDLPF